MTTCEPSLPAKHQATAPASSLPQILPHSAAVHAIWRQLAQLAQSPTTPVLFTGPAGSGKAFAAETLHLMTCNQGGAGPFIDVDCQVFTHETAEAVLFGVAASSTSANNDDDDSSSDSKVDANPRDEAETGVDANPRAHVAASDGALALADGGTLFLRHVEALPAVCQSRLLRFLDTGRYRRQGNKTLLTSRVRVVAASRCVSGAGSHAAGSVSGSATAGTTGTPAGAASTPPTLAHLRLDFYRRLAVFSMTLPGLEARQDDIMPLAEGYGHFFCAKADKAYAGFTDGAKALLLAHAYTAHVRELISIVERAVTHETEKTWVDG